jgi:hypothetical protein
MIEQIAVEISRFDADGTVLLRTGRPTRGDPPAGSGSVGVVGRGSGCSEHQTNAAADVQAPRIEIDDATKSCGGPGIQ